jgi:hypothetical protein
MAEAPFVKKQLLTSAAGCRRDDLTTLRVATELKLARKLSAHFIETDIAMISPGFPKRRFNRMVTQSERIEFPKRTSSRTDAP